MKKGLQFALICKLALLFGYSNAFGQCPSPEIAPWIESFTGISDQPCWTQSATSGGPWVYTGAPDLGGSSTIVDHTDGVSNNYAWVDFTGTDAGVILTGPEVDISALTVPTLSFWFLSHNNNGTVDDYNELYIEAWDGAAWQPVDMVSGEYGFGWVQFFFDLSSHVYATNLVQVRFRAESGGDTYDYDNDFLIDDVGVDELPSCLAPTSLSELGVTNSTANFSWSQLGTTVGWNIEWGAPGFTPGTGTEIGAMNTSNNPETIGGLSGSTNYDIYIQADCGGGDLSAWAGPLSVLTDCDIFIAPFLEDFNAGTQPLCWDNTSSNTVANGLWKFTGAPGYGATANGEPTGTYAWTDGSTPEVADITLTTPLIDVSTLTTPQLQFEWFSNNTDYPGDNVPLEVQINNGTGWTTLSTFSGDNEEWQEIEIVLYSYVNDTVQVRFITDQTVPAGDAFYNDILLDDVAIVEAPSCPRPSSIWAYSPGSDSVVVEWTSQGFETEWVLEYGAPGFTPGTGTSVVTTSNPYTLDMLTDNTEYEVYVRAICSAGDTSNYRGEASFTTLCLPFIAQAWCEDFSSTSTSQACWTVLNENGDGDTWDMDYGTNPFAGDEAASIYTNVNSGNNDDYLITPQLTLTGNEVMTFFYRVQSATDMNDFEVLLSTTGIDPADFQDTLMFSDSYGNITYEDTAVNLSAFSGNVYIAFHVPSGGLDGNRLYIDQVCVDICNPTPSIDGAIDVCRLDDSLDVNTVITPGENNGVWTFDSNPGVLNGSMLNISAMADDTYDIQYVVTTACTADTAYATVSIYGPSNAGENGVLEACMNQPIDLLGGLTGNIDLGGTWYGPSGAALSSGYFVTGQLPGQSNYSYITTNGVCPNDTSGVILNILPCDWLSVDELALEGVTVYPNPTSGTFYISNNENGQPFFFEVLDLNGRKVMKQTEEVAASSVTEVNLSNLENGIYMIRLFNNNGEKTVRIVKQ